MSTLFKFAVILLALLMVGHLMQLHAPSLFIKVAFNAPGVGAVSYAYCLITSLAVLMMAKLNWK